MRLVAKAFEMVDELLHSTMPHGWSPKWICHTADVCYGGPCDSPSRICRLVHKWISS